MSKALVAIVITYCLSLSAVCQSSREYQVGTITAVERTQGDSNAPSEAKSYDVSVQVDGTVYVVRYKDSHAVTPVRYATGGNVVVLVGEETIRYNDIMGVSHELPIVSRKFVNVSQARAE